MHAPSDIPNHPSSEKEREAQTISIFPLYTRKRKADGVAYQLKGTKRMYVITYFNRSLNKSVTAKYATLEAAIAVASEIFERTGIVVGIGYV